jgi:hypothetical protein
MKFQYYWNNVPGHGQCRNNLIYTSLISEDANTFVQWYFNDIGYHKAQNQVVDSDKMDEKWHREIKYLTLMQRTYPELVPEIINIDYISKKVYLKIDGPDFWEQSGCTIENYSKVLPDWEDQMLAIVKAHKDLGLFKYSMHPSSYFIVNGKLKSINYFFTYDKNDIPISISDVESHIYTTRQSEMRKHINKLGVEWDTPQSFEVLEQLCWASFSTNYPASFIKKVTAMIGS